jgi:hypothetical protein
MDRILLAAIVLLLGILAGRATNALVPERWLADHTKTAAMPDRWLATVARKSADDLRRERSTCDRVRFGFVSTMADDLCPPADPLPRLLWPEPRDLR